MNKNLNLKPWGTLILAGAMSLAGACYGQDNWGVSGYDSYEQKPPTESADPSTQSEASVIVTDDPKT